MISASEWHYISLSEERTVSQLIRNRSQLENLKSNEDVLCVLISLDRQIDRATLDDDQRELIRLLMAGNTLGDIATTAQASDSSLRMRFRNAVYRIVRQNNQDWEDVYRRYVEVNAR